MKLFNHNDNSHVHKMYNESISEAIAIVDRFFARAMHVRGMNNLGYVDVGNFKCETMLYPIELYPIKETIESLNCRL